MEKMCIFKDKGFNNEDREDWHRFWSKVDIKDNINDCWDWIESTNGKYGKFNLHDIAVLVHRIVYMLTKENIPEGLQVQHICNNPICCNPNHLELGNNSKNQQYRSKCGRCNVSGENNGNTILTEYQVREIHKLYNEQRKLHPGLKQWQITEPIAKKFCITKHHVDDIIHGKSWNHI